MSGNNGRISVPCAFCHAKGTDPYAVLSSRSRCEVCKGRKEVQIPQLNERCPFCKGTGSYKTFYCLVCRGKGAVAKVVAATEICPKCEGLAYDSSSGLPCVDCRGVGRVLVSQKNVGVAS